MNEQARADADRVRGVLDRLFEAYQRRDLTTMLNCYAPDVVTMMPFGEPLYGLDEWRKLLERSFRRVYILDLDVDVEEVSVNGHWAFEWHNEWSTQLLRETEEVRTRYIRGAQLLKRQSDGEWKVARYIANVVPLEEDLESHKAMIRSQSRRDPVGAANVAHPVRPWWM